MIELLLNKDRRVIGYYDPPRKEAKVFTETLPDGFYYDYLYIDNAYVYDPLAQPEPVDSGPSDHELLMALLGVTE